MPDGGSWISMPAVAFNAPCAPVLPLSNAAQAVGANAAAASASASAARAGRRGCWVMMSVLGRLRVASCKGRLRDMAGSAPEADRAQLRVRHLERLAAAGDQLRARAALQRDGHLDLLDALVLRQARQLFGQRFVA